ncbi:histidine--tRNA ligase [Schleiferiaceae bacterium]|jgi:histidyl-tRNA synthetase|nr:histidine--tRNA ligase [Schleiferiaceae bacterium]MDB4346861.1 histidine--tRNA ligase [bacterium]MDB2502714.1 histidine--tRNA ligase [Schleiferiaceae bacterium]MDB2539786.1 histidine--tRNA ligase [Schleiferiaceae bacterium]MDB2572342.1 histidine--tRNA ligase [Schleiferiaceae bacterium]
MKPSLAKGTRDFSAAEVQKRQYIMNVLREQFELRGYDPIETPSFENIETLTGKYGEEGDRLIFKILRSGDFTSKIDEGMWASKNPKTLTSKVADKALRYDLTVPFARYVVQHQNELAFPFKRYQMQPVWRADRPQKGRFREFYQCDADVVGSDSLWQEVELIQLYDASFTRLGLSTTIKLNNRKILAGMAEVLGISTDFIAFTVAIDKLDKVGPEGVLKEMRTQALPESAVIRFGEWLEEGLTLERLTGLLAESSEGKLGLEEMNFVMSQATAGLTSSELVFDFTLARGLNYYTGTIFEVAANGVAMGSIGGGGRYADLTSIFGMKNTSGVGISFGLDRIYLCLEELRLFPDTTVNSAAVLFANFGTEESVVAYQWVSKLVASGIRAELYPDASKLKKQFDFADKKGIGFLALVGTNEMAANAIPVKNLATGEQTTLDFEGILAAVKGH